MAEFKGDYLGFTFGGRHSSEFGIMRTSSSNRYEDKLNGTLKENTQARTDADGTFYFGTTVSQKQFTINFAFDHMTETQLNNMKKWLNPKEIKDLIFDEDNTNQSIGSTATTLKIWKAKVTGQTSVKHLCFDENGERIYKGDGSIQFTCYCPYAFGNYELSSGATTSVKGDLDVNFEWRYNLSSELPKDTCFSLYTSDGEEIAKWQLNKASGYTTSSSRLFWNSETGLVYFSDNLDTNGAPITKTLLPISGKTVVKLTPGNVYLIRKDYDPSNNQTTSAVGMIKYTPLYY